MKFTTVMAVLAVSLAFATTGCKYDKAGKGAGGAGAGADDSAQVSDISTSDDDAISQAQSGSISDAGERRFEDIYAKCTDVAFEPVYFGFDSTVVPAGEISKIDAVTQHLSEKTDRVVVIEGNCDERGSNEYNLELGSLRAISIRDYLATLGISGDRVQTKSYGEEKPAVMGTGEEVWAQNRRGEFAIYKHK